MMRTNLVRASHAPLREINSLTLEELRALAFTVRRELMPTEVEDGEPLVDVNGGDLVETVSEQCLALGVVRDEAELNRDETRWCPRCAMYRLGEHVEPTEESTRTGGGFP